MVVFATSVDDFVISSFLSTGASTETVPIKIYSGATRRLDACAERARHGDVAAHADRRRRRRRSCCKSIQRRGGEEPGMAGGLAGLSG